MNEIIINLFGAYEPITDETGLALSGMAGVNWPWIAGVVLFALVLFSFLRMVGVLLKK